MDCKVVLQLLPAYYENQLAQDVKDNIDSHLEICPSCSDTLRALRDLPDLVRALPPEGIPKTLRQKIRFKIRASHNDYKAGKFKGMSKTRRPLWQYAIGLLCMLGFSLIVAGIAVVLILENDPWKFNPPAPHGPFVPQGSIERDLAREIGGEKPSDQQAKANVPRPISYLPKPEFVKSDTKYSEHEIEMVAIKPIVVSFAEEYRVLEVSQYREELMAELIAHAYEHDKEAKAFGDSLRMVLNMVGKPSLPSYTEEASINGKKAWIIVVNWADGENSQPLSRIVIFAIDPVTARIIDSWPPMPLNVSDLLAKVNPHKEITCMACHPNFDTLKPGFKRSSWWKSTARIACIRCHDHKKHYSVYAKSIHGQLAIAGKLGTKNLPAPTCIDCHLGHTTLALKRISPDEGKNAQAKKICGDCHRDRWEAYNDYYHGKASKADAPDAPVCWDCHGSHDIQPSDNPKSRTADSNLPRTCKKCHDGAAHDFVQYGKLVHGYRRQMITDIARRYIDNGLEILRNATVSVRNMF